MKGDSRIKVKTKSRNSWQNSSRSSATIHAAIVGAHANKENIKLLLFLFIKVNFYLPL